MKTWNILLKEVQANTYKMIMPDRYGNLRASEVKTTENGFLVHWPVNPHFSGESTIIKVLKMQNPRWEFI